MAFIELDGSNIGNALKQLLMAEDIEPGDQISYATCKAILAYHPLGLKMTRSPVCRAMAKPREIAVPDGPEEQCVDAFNRAWKNLDVDTHIKNAMTIARAYGASAVVALVEEEDPSEPLDLQNLGFGDLTFNVLDPLNTSGSMVNNQNPNSSQFLRASTIRSNGVIYHKSRTITMFNEQPIYLAYTASAFGYVGRSVFQRALFPMKTYLQTLITDDLVTRKAGVLVAKLKGLGAVVDQMIAFFNRKKREIVQDAQTGNVISISSEDDVLSLNLQNAEGPMTVARKNAIENIATAADMPAILLNQESFAEGFGEGTEDANHVIQYLEDLRNDMSPLFDFFDRIVMYRAWTREFFENIQRLYPEEYAGVTYEVAFYRWANSFKATWPSLKEEKESEQVEVEKVKFETVNSVVALFKEELDPQNKAKLFAWATDNLNSSKRMFTSPLEFDEDLLVLHGEEMEEREKQQALAPPDNPFGTEPGEVKPPRPKFLNDDQYLDAAE